MSSEKNGCAGVNGSSSEESWESPFAPSTASRRSCRAQNEFLALPWAETEGIEMSESPAIADEYDFGEIVELTDEELEVENERDSYEERALEFDEEKKKKKARPPQKGDFAFDCWPEPQRKKKSKEAPFDSEEEAFSEGGVDLENELDELVADLEDDGKVESEDFDRDDEWEADVRDEWEVEDQAEGENEDEGEVDDEWEAEGEDARVIKADSFTIDRVPLLEKHRGIGPDLVLAWNDMLRAPTSVDVVVHLHGYSLSKGTRLDIVQDLKARSGLDWADPKGVDRSPGRTRPTLALLPRGNFFGGKSGRGYSFPALVDDGGLLKLCELGLQQLASRLNLGRLTARRLILTAHSGGGAALLRILRTADPHEVHVFDGLYQSADALTTWAETRIARDVRALASGANAERYMGADGGALRVLYRSGTAQHSRPVAAALKRALPAGSPLSRWYRVERTSTGHVQIPPVFGWRLLTNAAADLPGVPYVPTAPRTRRMTSNEGFDEEFEGETPKRGTCSSEPPTTAPPPASDITSWPGHTDAQLEFMRSVYNRAVQRAQAKKGARFVPSVPEKDLDEVEPGECMRTPAAERCRALLDAGRVALAAERDARNPAALKVTRFGASSGYRSVRQQFTGWQNGFRSKYYPDTQTQRDRLPEGAHSDKAVNCLARYAGQRIGAPGYSKHNAGLAMDFFTVEDGRRLGPNTARSNVDAWKQTWLFRWLLGHANAYHFYQNTTIDEPWHWEYRGPGIDRSADVTTGSTASARAAEGGRMGFSTRTMRPDDWKTVKHFRASEFKSPEKMGFDFIRWLDKVADAAGVPMVVTSSYRSPAYNKSVGGAQDSAHTDVPCNAVDIGRRPTAADPNWNLSRFAIITAALKFGCTRIGMYPGGSLHLDRTEEKRPARRIWTAVDNPAK